MSLVRAFVQPFREAPCNGVAKTPRVSVYVIKVPVKRVKSGERETALEQVAWTATASQFSSLALNIKYMY